MVRLYCECMVLASPPLWKFLPSLVHSPEMPTDFEYGTEIYSAPIGQIRGF